MTIRDRAACCVERHGLLQGALYAHHLGYSAVGAIQSAANYNPLQSSVGSRKVVAEIEAELGVDDLQAWNDEEGRTKTEVIEALRGEQGQQLFL